MSSWLCYPRYAGIERAWLIPMSEVVRVGAARRVRLQRIVRPHAHLDREPKEYAKNFVDGAKRFEATLRDDANHRALGLVPGSVAFGVASHLERSEVGEPLAGRRAEPEERAKIERLWFEYDPDDAPARLLTQTQVNFLGRGLRATE